MRGLRRTGSVKTWRKVPPKIVIDAPGVQVPDNAGEGLFSKCFILAVTNPQPMIFCVSLMPQVIAPALALFMSFGPLPLARKTRMRSAMSA